jgi:hypothetical protein
MWPPQGGTPIASSITVFPSLPTLSQSGQTQQFTAIVLDMNGNELTPGAGGIPALVWASSNPSVATVNASTGFATAVASGTATITATCGAHGGGTQLTVGVGSGTSFTPNLPAGMTTVLNTGAITATPATQGNGQGLANYLWNIPNLGGLAATEWSNLSPATPSSIGEWAGNLGLTSWASPGDTGLRFQYPPSLDGGNSPVRIFTTNGWSVTPASNTGYLYTAGRFRYSPGFSLSTASGMKWMRVYQTDGPNNNHFTGFGSDTLATDGTQLWYGGLLQFNSSSYFANIPGAANGTACSPSFASIVAGGNVGGTARGSWHTIEQYRVPEPTPGSPGAQWYFWVDGVLVWSTFGKSAGTGGLPTSGCRFNEAGESPGYGGIIFDPTYGGDPATDHPPTGCWWDMDFLYVALR